MPAVCPQADSTALHEAVFRGSVGCVAALVAARADVGARSLDVRSFSGIPHSCGGVLPPCHSPARTRGRPRSNAEVMTPTPTCAIPVPLQGCVSPLHLAAQRGHTECAEALLAAGSDKDARAAVRGAERGGKSLTTQIDCFPARAQPRCSVVSLISRAPRTPPCFIPCVQAGLTPLHFAAMAGELACVRLLIEAGAERNPQCKARRGARRSPGAS